jgi:hypothetical protein
MSTDFNNLVSLKAAAFQTQQTAKTTLESARSAFFTALAAWGLDTDIKTNINHRPFLRNNQQSVQVTPGTPDLNSLATTYQSALTAYNTATTAYNTASQNLASALAASGVGSN